MHSLNSIAGIRKYRFLDEMPEGSGSGMTGVSPVSIDVSMEKHHELTEKPEDPISRVCTSLRRMASRIMSR